MKHVRKLLAQGIIQLDPLDCGSSIAYAVSRRRYGLTGDVDLSDCNHKIHWYFGKDDLGKIDAAINILVEFRQAYAAAIHRTRKAKRK